jgi:hypothetical protein
MSYVVFHRSALKDARNADGFTEGADRTRIYLSPNTLSHACYLMAVMCGKVFSLDITLHENDDSGDWV